MSTTHLQGQPADCRGQAYVARHFGRVSAVVFGLGLFFFSLPLSFPLSNLTDSLAWETTLIRWRRMNVYSSCCDERNANPSAGRGGLITWPISSVATCPWMLHCDALAQPFPSWFRQSGMTPACTCTCVRYWAAAAAAAVLTAWAPGAETIVCTMRTGCTSISMCYHYPIRVFRSATGLSRLSHRRPTSQEPVYRCQLRTPFPTPYQLTRLTHPHMIQAFVRCRPGTSCLITPDLRRYTHAFGQCPSQRISAGIFPSVVLTPPLLRPCLCCVTMLPDTIHCSYPYSALSSRIQIGCERRAMLLFAVLIYTGH